jgi:3-hydroxyisobutyrate dehydrogenase-like beta-hydroxyacid dehydrogenase
MTKLAFLGLGQMGEPMARRLREAGHDVTVWNRTRSRADALAEEGAAVADSPAQAAAAADAAFTMLADPAALRDVVLGPGGLASGLARGSVLVEMSTVGPDAVREIASRLPEGVEMLDAPVLGSVPAVIDGSLKVLVGGDRETYERSRETLEVFGPTTHVGELGAGASMKLVANSTLGAAVVGLGEALALADRLGVEQAVALDILSGGALGNAVQRTRGAIESGTYEPRFKLSLAEKDLRLVQDAARAAGLDLPLAGAARAWFEDAAKAGRGDQDYPAVIPHIRGEG